MEAMEPFKIESVEVDQSNQAVIREAFGEPVTITFIFDRPLTDIERAKVKKCFHGVAGNPETLTLEHLAGRKLHFRASDQLSVTPLLEQIRTYSSDWTKDAKALEESAADSLRQVQEDLDAELASFDRD